MSPSRVFYTADEIRARREVLLKRLPVPELELRARASALLITTGEAELLRELDDLDFLEAFSRDEYGVAA